MASPRLTLGGSETVPWLLKHNQHCLDISHISLSSTIQIIYHHILLYIQYSDLWHTLDLIMCIKTMYACMCSLHAGLCVHLCRCVCTLIKVHVHMCEYMYCMCEYACKQGVISSSNTQNYNNTNIIDTAKLPVHVTCMHNALLQLSCIEYTLYLLAWNVLFMSL